MEHEGMYIYISNEVLMFIMINLDIKCELFPDHTTSMYDINHERFLGHTNIFTGACSLHENDFEETHLHK